jgi:hypothetical protein
MSISSSQSIFLIKSSKHKGFGTGFVVHTDERGCYLLTNAHVVEECGEDTLEVDGKKATLLQMGSSSEVDLALLYVEGSDGIALKLSSSLAQKGVLIELNGFRQHLHGNHKLEALRGSIKKLSTLYAGSEKIEKYELNIDKEDAIQRGYSGSPVLCPSSGNVIAIITTRYNETHAEAIPMGYLSSLWNDMPQGLLGSEVCDDRVKKGVTLEQVGIVATILATVIAGIALFMPSGTSDEKSSNPSNKQEIHIVGDRNKPTQSIDVNDKSVNHQVVELNGSDNTIKQEINIDNDTKELCRDGIANYEKSIKELEEELTVAKMQESKKIIGRDLAETKQQLSEFRKKCGTL